MSYGIFPCTSDDLLVGTYNLALNGIDLGSTTGSVTITRNSTYTDVRNDQSCLLQARYENQQDWVVTTTMRELSLDKLRLIYGMKDGALQSVGGTNNVLCLGQNSGTGCSFPEEFCLTVCGPGPGCGCRTIHFPRVVFTPETLEIAISKENPVGLEVQFTPLSSCPSGNVACMYDSDTCGNLTYTVATVNDMGVATTTDVTVVPGTAFDASSGVAAGTNTATIGTCPA